ncbi:MAG: IclR family transcriptional regulator domain-containing protein, partial [Ilumatobacteraceae bacterium]
MAQRSDNREFVEALARGLDIIRSFNEFNPLRTVSDLAAELKLARPTVHRIMLTLEELGYVVQTDNGYYLSAKVIELGFGYIATRGFYGAAKTHMEKLAAQIDQAISLTELVDSDIIYIGRIEVPKVVAYNVALGQRLPAHSTSSGRLLLSSLDDAEIDRRLNMPSLS